MSEQYVSKAALTETVYLSMRDNPHKDGKIRANHNNEHMRFAHMIYHAPAADVRPVVHGRWIEGLDGSCMCSVCNQVIRYEIGYFCPKCGATMDLESKGMWED